MISKCGKCEGTRFELKENSPVGSAFKINLVQCASCGTPVGVVDYYDIHTAVQKNVSAIKELGGKVDNLEYMVRQIAAALSRVH